MASTGGHPAPSGGGKKSVDFQLNMVPFIDLLSVLIAFLLMTSVWTQIGRIDVHSSIDEPGAAPKIDDVEDALDLAVIIKGSGYMVTKKGTVLKEIARTGDAYDTSTLDELLRQTSADHPLNHDVRVTSEDNVPYKELIRVMDVCLKRGLTGISVSGVDV